MSKTNEWAALVERIKETELADSPKLCRLLDFLFKNRNVRLQSKQIEADHFGETDLADRHDVGGHSREEVSRLKKGLYSYALKARNEKWECFLPHASRSEGYQLAFRLSREERTATEILWAPHLERADGTILITGSHLFFFDPKKKAVLRYYDFNPQASDKDDLILKTLRKTHPDRPAMNLMPWHNVYLASGDIHAHESLARWFYAHTGVYVERVTSRDISDKEYNRRAPILIGRPETNRFVNGIYESRQGAHLRYRIHTQTSGVKILGIQPHEQQKLAGRFPVTRGGVVGPVPKSDTVFGIVARVRNPNGYGHITLVLSDYYAMVIARIVEAMTDEKHAAELLTQMEWPRDQALPDSFEMLFSVALSPGKAEGEGFPELLCWSKV